MPSDHQPSEEQSDSFAAVDDDKTVVNQAGTADNTIKARPNRANHLGRGDIIGNMYKVLDFLGSGGMSDVYQCEDLSIGRVVAVKTLKLGYDEDSLRRFQTEGKAIARLEHPNIVKLYGLQTIGNGIPLLLMEYVPGKTLAQVLEKGVPLAVPRALKIASQVIEALKSAEKQGVIHRDLKPSNIMIVNPGALEESVKILDFGIAKIQGEPSINATQTGEVFGTPKYMSPEQVLGKKCDGRADQYAFGCILFEMLSGQSPYKGDNAFSIMMAHTNDRIPTLSKVANQPVPAYLDMVLNKLLQKEPENRYANMEEVSDALFRTKSKSTNLVKYLIAGAIAAFFLMVFVISQIFVERKPSQSTNTADIKVARASNANVRTTVNPAESFAAKEPSEGDKRLEAQVAARSSATVLELNKQDITDFGLASIAKMKHLRLLNLSRNLHVTSKGVALLENLPLQSLNLDGTGIDDQASEYIARITTLKELDLNNTELSNESCQHLSKLPVLKKLWLGSTGVTSRALPFLSQLKTLEYLNLSEDDVAENLDELGLSNIKELCLTKIKNANVAAGALADVKSLEVVDFRGTNLDDGGLKVVVGMPNLQKVMIEGCKAITPDTIEEIRASQSLPILVGAPVDDHFRSTKRQLLKNGSFETPRINQLWITLREGDTKLESWEIVHGSIDLASCFPTPSGRNAIDLNGDGQGEIAQTFATEPGATYLVEFIAGRHPHEPQPVENFVVSVADVSKTFSVSGLGHSQNTTNWRTIQLPFKAKSNKTTLRFRSLMEGVWGVCLDGVSVSKMAN